MNDFRPHSVILGPNTYVAPTAFVGGSVRFGSSCTVMHHVTIRGDVAAITLGHCVNIQDGCMVHTRSGVDLVIGDNVAVGHRAVVHGKSVGPRTLIGIGSIVLDDCEIGEECIIAAGAVLAPGTIVPRRTVMMGIPGKPVRLTSDNELRYIDEVVANYVALGRRHARGDYPNAALTADRLRNVD